MRHLLIDVNEIDDMIKDILELLEVEVSTQNHQQRLYQSLCWYYR